MCSELTDDRGLLLLLQNWPRLSLGKDKNQRSLQLPGVFVSGRPDGVVVGEEAELQRAVRRRRRGSVQDAESITAVFLAT